jgi:hypothetical protein
MSMRKAINAKCKDCIFDPFDRDAGKWRQQVEACTSTDCGLWPYRPKSTKAVNSAESATLANMGEAAEPGHSGTVNAVCAPTAEAPLGAGSDSNG